MQSSGFVPRSTVDVGDLVELFRHPGPSATVSLTTDAELGAVLRRGQ